MADSEERETKPFKFVTAGTHAIPAPYPKASPHKSLTRAGFDARFPNQNQTKHVRLPPASQPSARLQLT